MHLPTMNGRHSPLPAASHRLHHEGIKQLELFGRNGFDKEVPWVPYNSLRGYWDTRVMDVLRPINPMPPATAIRNKYLRVFTILVLLDKLDYLEWFTSYGLDDSQWPQTELYYRWPSTDAFVDFFKQFKDLQWKFFPLELHRDELIDREIPADRILPFETIRRMPTSVISSSEDATTFEVTAYEPLAGVPDSIGQRKPRILLKKYDFGGPRGGNQEREYRREHKAYSLLQSVGPSPYVVSFYGSYRQNHTGNLILEFVDGGTLLDYLKDNNPPQRPSDVYDFWNSASCLLLGLRKVHQVTETSIYPQQGVVHQDIKLDNILVSMNNPEFRYKFNPKLVDFGLSGVGTVSNGDETLKSPHHRGNATNSAPETALHLVAFQYGPDTVTSALDIWALGCIFAHLAAWVADGFDNMDTFDELRFEQHSSHPRFRKTSYNLSFHDGGHVLPAVHDYLSLIASQIIGNGSQDQITPRILNIVKEHMLSSTPGSRLDAKQIQSMIGNILHELKPDADNDDAKLQYTPSTRSKHRQSQHRSSQSSSGRPILTVDQCVEYREATRNGRVPDPTVQAAINRLKKDLENRDHIFLIDDSQSMNVVRELVRHVFTGLSYVAKQLDDNGIELAFLSTPSKIHRSQKTTQLIDMVKTHPYEHNSWMTEDKLGKFFDQAVIPKLHNILARILKGRKRPLTVFIFTDGGWGADDSQAAGVQNPVLRLMREVESLKISRTWVTLQFIRFGNDRDGERYLRYLDEMGASGGL